MGSQIKRLSHIGKAESLAGVARGGVQLECLLDDVVGDRGEEYAEVGGDVLPRGDGRLSLICSSIDFVLLVGDDHRAGEVEVLLMQLSLVGVCDKVTVNTGLKLVVVGIVEVVGGVGQVCEGDAAQTVQVATSAANSLGNVLVESLSVLMTSARNKARGHYVGTAKEPLSMTSKASHLE